MAKKAQSKSKALAKCRECENWEDVSSRVRVQELLDKTIKQFESKIKSKEYDPTVTEYLKLLQLRQEMGLEDDAKEIKVTWVNPEATSDAEK